MVGELTRFMSSVQGCASSSPVAEPDAARKYAVPNEPAVPLKQAPAPAAQDTPAPTPSAHATSTAATEGGAIPQASNGVKPSLDTVKAGLGSTTPSSQNASGSQVAVSQSLKSLSINEANTVQSTLLKVGV